MARTDRKGAAVGLVARTSAELATVGFGERAWSAEDVDHIFRTVARACTDQRDRWLYLAKCQANGLNPLKGELHAVERTIRPRDGKPFKTVTFVTSWYVFLSRVRQAGAVMRGEVVYENDDFLMDAITGAPETHKFAVKNRGKPVGAWASAVDVATNRVLTGKYWPDSELLSKGPNPLRDQIPAHFMWKTAMCRVARVVCPDLQSLYTPEEFGVAVVDDNERKLLPPSVQTQLEGTPEEQIVAQPQMETGQGPPCGHSACRQHWIDTGSEACIDEEIEDADYRITLKQRGELFSALKLAGHTSTEQIRSYLKGILGRDVADTKTLSHREFQTVMARLSEES